MQAIGERPEARKAEAARLAALQSTDPEALVRADKTDETYTELQTVLICLHAVPATYTELQTVLICLNAMPATYTKLQTVLNCLHAMPARKFLQGFKIQVAWFLLWKSAYSAAGSSISFLFLYVFR
jgi:hypothetical protein